MQAATDPLLVVLLLVNFFLLGTSRMRALISASAVQGVLLALLVLSAHGEFALQAVLIALGTLVLKGAVIPSMLSRALRDVAIHREIEPVIGFVPSLLLGGLGTGLSLVFSRTLPLATQHAGSLLIPAALATAFSGFLLMATRRKAVTQVVGYLALENGIFVMGLTLVEAMPLFVEIGVLLDLVVAIFVMGIIIEHISREFSSIDTTRLTSLKE
ncbi:MAG TPA: hydrogenase [Myxococcales bacterium]|nr:hydrogenase [Myxococcales bacterium]